MAAIGGGSGGGFGGVPVFRSAHSRGQDGPQKKRAPRKPSPRAKKQPIELTAIIAVPTSLVGHVIGKNGAFSKEVETTTGARVAVPARTEPPQGASFCAGGPDRIASQHAHFMLPALTADSTDVRVSGSARGVLHACFRIAHMLGHYVSNRLLPCRLEFAGVAVPGQLATRPMGDELYQLFEADAAAPAQPTAVVSAVDVFVSDEHVEAAVDDAVFVHGGFAGKDVDAWVAGEPRMLFAWALARPAIDEVLSALQAALSDDVTQ